MLSTKIYKDYSSVKIIRSWTQVEQEASRDYNPYLVWSFVQNHSEYKIKDLDLDSLQFTPERGGNAGRRNSCLKPKNVEILKK